ncbi:MAG: hypothetical protein Q7K44_04170 [Candidatus Liptonbacteria bacterium]|nr:hypothetical protein [Candidatus Liptonbacteria bacterium]
MKKLISKIKNSIFGRGKDGTTSGKSAPVTKGKPIGEITHYYGDISVAIVKFSRPFKCGEKVHFAGATTDFKETVKSMQYEHKPIETAQKGQEVGIKVGDKVREGDEVFEA